MSPFDVCRKFSVNTYAALSLTNESSNLNKALSLDDLSWEYLLYGFRSRAVFENISSP